MLTPASRVGAAKWFDLDPTDESVGYYHSSASPTLG